MMTLRAADLAWLQHQLQAKAGHRQSSAAVTPASCCRHEGSLDVRFVMLQGMMVPGPVRLATFCCSSGMWLEYASALQMNRALAL